MKKKSRTSGGLVHTNLGSELPPGNHEKGEGGTRRKGRTYQNDAASLRGRLGRAVLSQQLGQKNARGNLTDL